MSPGLGVRNSGPKPSMRLLTVLAALLLAACGGGEEELALACPQPAIIEELASVESTREGGDPSQIENLSYSAALQNIGGTCRADGADLLIEVTIETSVRLGPAFPGGPVELPYFVAVVTPDGSVLDREDFLASVPVTVERGGGATRESVSQRFVGLGEGAPGYRILFGLTLPDGPPSPGA